MISKEDTQLLKGLAIMMVIIQHIGQILHISVLNPLGPIGVCLFLFISGYGLSFSYEKNGRSGYFVKRVLKVYIPYLVSIALFCVWSFWIGNISYEFYLAHILPLDWIKQQVTIKNFLIYGAFVLLGVVILYVANRSIQRIGESVMRK